MNIGKLTDEQLRQYVFSRIKRRHKEVLLGPGAGEDCGVMDFGDKVCVLSTDPITAASARAGELAVLVSCNDVASAGAKPIGMLVTLLAPPGTELDELTGILDGLMETADALNVDIVGGHTEITDAVNRCVLSTTVLASAEKSRVVTTSGAQAGDDIVMTKQVGLEGTCILATDYTERCLEVLSESELKQAQALGDQISVLKEGLLCADFGVHAMHDITEGGVLGAAWEMANASGVGAHIIKGDVPVHPVTKKLCAHFGLNPYGLISSGSMLISCPDGAALCGHLRGNGVQAAIIGSMTEDMQIVMEYEGQLSAIPAPAQDEIYKIFA